MDKIVWIVESRRDKILELQRKINAYGGMRAMCMLTTKAVENTIIERIDKGESTRSHPSLILMDYDFISADETVLKLVKSHPKLAGVPLFLMVDDDGRESNDVFYFKGAMVVLNKNLGESEIIRIERAAWQYEVTKSYEYVLQKQTAELETAKKIKRLNDQLASRNQFLHSIFGKYFSDEFIEMILDKKENELLGGDRRHIAVLFSDLRGFSSIAEEISGEAMTALLNCYFGAMMDGITRYHGTVIEYMGDGVLAVFGAPVKSDNYCENAVAAAVHMQNSMEKVNDFCKKNGLPGLNLGIAIHCGEGFVGNVGTEKMMRYNVIGNVVNICSRIEGCSLGGQILISKEMEENIKVPLKVKERSQIFAKGISKAVDFCQVEGIGGDYNCYLNNAKPRKSYAVDETVYFEVHKIHNKVVDKFGQKMKLLSVSDKELIVSQPEMGRQFHDTDLYSDVEIIADDFEGTYCKVIKVDVNRVCFYVTKRSKGYMDFMRKLMRDIIAKESNSMNSIDLEQLYQQFTLEKVDISVLSDDVASDEKATGNLTLLWAIDGEDVKVRFYSKEKAVRALEFVDYLLGDFGMVKGTEKQAGGIISHILLKVMMSDMDETDVDKFFNRMIRMYFDKCEWIFADDYVKENLDEIRALPMYGKKMISWAYVRTVDIAPIGSSFLLRSLENESDIEIASSEELYIMIGCRGEIYNISREKFMRTYDASEEDFDIFEKLPEYMPEVKLSENGEYVSLDEKAKLCYPKSGRVIYAKQLKCRTKVFSNENQGEYFVGKPGDYMAFRGDDLEDIYIIQKEIFEETYIVQE